LFTSFGYFDSDKENFDVLKKAYKLLRVDGFFVLDYLNKNFVKHNLIPNTTDSFVDTKITQKRFIEGERIIKEITVEKNGETKKYLESVRMYNRNELLETLQKIGFKFINTFGDFNGNQFKLESSPRIIIIACK